MKERKKWLGILLPIFLTVLFCLINMVALVSMIHMQGNARVVNYTGIVRGATQRLVKQEMKGYPNDELMQYLDGLVPELCTGKGDNNLNVISDDDYQELAKEMCGAWKSIRSEIFQVRQGGDSQKLFESSESYLEFQCGDIEVTSVIGDNLRITQVFVNLISNALKFTPAGGRVILEAHETEIKDQEVSLQFTVTDSGIGINEEFQKRILFLSNRNSQGLPGNMAAPDLAWRSAVIL